MTVLQFVGLLGLVSVGVVIMAVLIGSLDRGFRDMAEKLGIVHGAEWQKRYDEGYSYQPWTPYTCSDELRRERGRCNANRRHTPARDGSWVFGASICGNCGMTYDVLPLEVRQRMADQINALPADEQQLAAGYMSGGGLPHYKPSQLVIRAMRPGE